MNVLHNQLKRTFVFPIILLLSALLMGCGTLANTSKSTDAFSAQRGNLVWPVQGEVTESFGKQINPAYGTHSYNPGILISTNPDVDVQSVFAGEVSAVYTMPEFGRVVTINHGEYTSLYGNLSEMYVEEGMKVEEGQVIGVSGTADEPKGQAIFFAIFHDGAEADPEPWLASGNINRSTSTSSPTSGSRGW